MAARLIINADDFGLTPGINRAVAELHRAAALTSATLMATGPAFADAVQTALAHPTLGVGAHIVLTDGVPVSHPYDIPTLLGADGKTFRPSLTDFAQAILRGTIRENDIMREASAQIQKIQRAGIDITHIDTHKHTHIFPAVLRPLLHVAQRCGVNAVRNPFEPDWSRTSSNRGSSLLRRLQLSLLHRFQPSFQSIIQSLDAELTTSGTLGINATGNLTEKILFMILGGRGEQCGDEDIVYELCCHPGYHDAELDLANTRLLASRDVEREALLAFIPKLMLEPNPFQLIHYGDLGIPGHQRSVGHFTPNTGYEKVL